MWWKIILIIVIGIVGLVILANLIGLFLPKSHTASRRVAYQQPASTLWETISDFAQHVTWRDDVREMKRLDDRDGQPVWQQIGKKGDRFSMQVIEFDPPRRMVTRIVDNHMFGGTWTWEIAPLDDSSAALTITEHGEIYLPAFRIFAHLGDMRATMDRVHRALGRRFGEEVQWSD